MALSLIYLWTRASFLHLLKRARAHECLCTKVCWSLRSPQDSSLQAKNKNKNPHSDLLVWITWWASMAFMVKMKGYTNCLLSLTSQLHIWGGAKLRSLFLNSYNAVPKDYPKRMFLYKHELPQDWPLWQVIRKNWIKTRMTVYLEGAERYFLLFRYLPPGDWCCAVSLFWKLWCEKTLTVAVAGHNCMLLILSSLANSIQWLGVLYCVWL